MHRAMKTGKPARPVLRAAPHAALQPRHVVGGGVLAALVCTLIAAWASTFPTAQGQAYLPATMVDAIDAALFLTQFKAALDAAGLLDQMQSPDFNGTVFAPNDSGFTAYLAAQNTTLAELQRDNNTLKALLSFHIVPDLKYYPLSTFRNDAKIVTLQGSPLTVDRTTPGVVHLWAQPKDLGVTNFGTILQYQEVAGGKAVLYVIDKPMTPPTLVKTVTASSGRARRFQM